MTKAATATIEVTEKELAYLMRMTNYPYGNHPALRSKLGDARRDLLVAKRRVNRENKLARTVRLIVGDL